MQDHGGWGARNSLGSYDHMKAGEEHGASNVFKSAIRECSGEPVIDEAQRRATVLIIRRH